MNIVRPTLLLNEEICRRNIRRMADKAAAHDLAFRPHFKTHQSLAVGEWIREAGATQCTVSSVQMAGYFADGGWDDISVAFPLNALEADEINRIAAKAKLNLLAIEPESVRMIQQKLRSQVGIFIEIDAGYHRTGIDASRIDEINALISVIISHPLTAFRGFLTHSGHTYGARGQEQIKQIHHDSQEQMKALAGHYRARFPNLVVSVGDTPSCSVADDFTDVDEIRPGNFVFYDVMQCDIGSCQPEDIAIALACPVVGVYPDRGEIVLHGGGVHLSKDSWKRADGVTHFGTVSRLTSQGWESQPSGYLRSLSQEHGMVVADAALLSTVKVGDVLAVLPVHSCMTADCMGSYQTLGGQTISMMRKSPL